MIHEVDLRTTFARLAGATGDIPTDRVVDGIDQTALLVRGDTNGRRDYNSDYTGNILTASTKGRFKRIWFGEHPGLPGAAFYDLYNDLREVNSGSGWSPTRGDAGGGPPPPLYHVTFRRPEHQWCRGDRGWRPAVTQRTAGPSALQSRSAVRHGRKDDVET